MFVNFHCGDCESSYKIDLERYIERNSSASRNVFSELNHIRCIACDSELPDDVSTKLYWLIRTYKESTTNWKLSFELKDAKTSNDTP